VSLAASALLLSDLPSSPWWPARPLPTSPLRCPDEASTLKRPLRSSPPGRTISRTSIACRLLWNIDFWGGPGLLRELIWTSSNLGVVAFRLWEKRCRKSRPELCSLHTRFPPNIFQCSRAGLSRRSIAKYRISTGSRRSLMVFRTFSSFRYVCPTG
jgi:hypothetical protein